MKFRTRITAITVALLVSNVCLAQEPVEPVPPVAPADETLKLAALHALVAAPPERALPLVSKVLAADNSKEVKERALFVLSQIDMPEARSQLLEVARSDDPDLSFKAVRMIGISGHPEVVSQLQPIYAAGDERVRGAVLEAYMIAGDKDSVFRIAQQSSDIEEFKRAVHLLGAMGAVDELRSLSQSSGFTEEIIHALGIAGGNDVGDTLMEIYRNADTDDIRDAALQGMLIAGHDDGVISLYRESNDPGEKRRLLEVLSIMGSDSLMDIIDDALTSSQ